MSLLAPDNNPPQSIEDLQKELALARRTIKDLQEELDETNRGLLALSMELEDRVTKRTQELEKSNLKLKRTLDEKQRAENEILELAKFPGQNPHPVLQVDMAGTVLYANQAATPILHLWGCRAGDQMPEKWRVFICGVYQSGTIQNRELQCDRAIFYATFSPIKDAGYVNIYAHEITDLKITEEELKWELELNTKLAELSRELLRQEGGIETAAEKILFFAKKLTHSQHGLVSSINTRTGENLWHTFTAMMGKECKLKKKDQHLAFPPQENRLFSSLWGHSLNIQQGFFTNNPSEHHASRGLPDGHIPIKRFLSTPVFIGEELMGQISLANPPRDYGHRDLEAVNGLARLYALALDRHRSRQEKRVLEKNLRQAQKLEAAGTLAGGIAHDFNNILAAMIGYVDLTMHQIEPQSMANHNLKMVLKAGERARNLIKQILAFSRHTEKEVKPFNIAPVIKEALKLLRASLPTTVQIEQDIMPDPGNVLADPSQIHQVMMNLCTNAAHAMRENGGVLKITLDKHFFNSRQITHKPGMRAGAYVRLQVSDTGHGIDPSVIDRVFEPYFTTKKSHEGTGLGLAVVHGIVKGSGGDISVYSEPGQGTVFKILFPSIEQSVEDKSEVEDLAIGRGQRVLFVDDEALLVDVAKQMLPQLGYKVSSFTSSVEALESFRRTPEKFDLVITDYTMPKMTGTQLAREMHSIKPEVSIILCTGFNQNLNQEELSDFGIDALLMKPLYEHELAQVLHRVLDKDRPK